uniref:Uncharacterized protein n=1 Tax=Rhizophora mucronata TaxID=61149 RepID=A0A2P2N5M2_RHIMU
MNLNLEIMIYCDSCFSFSYILLNFHARCSIFWSSKKQLKMENK